MRAITPQEQERVLQFIEERGTLKNPLKALGGLMLDLFGWEVEAGKLRVKKILKVLAAEGKIECEFGKRNVLLTVGPVKAEQLLPESFPEAVILFPQVFALPHPRNGAATKAAQIAPSGAKTAAAPKSESERIEEAKVRVGYESEARFGRMLKLLLAVLVDKFPGFVRSASYARSARKSQEDRAGEDFRISVNALDDLDEPLEGEIIYDVKHSPLDAAKFNESISHLRGQRLALLKKALVVNRKRLNTEIAGEVIDDMIAVGLLPRDPVIKERILKFIF